MMGKAKARATAGWALALAVGGLAPCCLRAGQERTPSGIPVSTPPEVDKAGELVRQLGSKEFARREAAEKALAVLGAKAIPAVQVGLASPDPEVARRCTRVLTLIREVELGRFVKAFAADAGRTARFDHPVWRRYAALVQTHAAFCVSGSWGSQW